MQERARQETKLKNPKEMFYAGGFEKQYQDPPGLQKEMSPKPDCGEASYQGSGKLKGRKALITGGDSGIGRAVAIAFAREGADVAVAYLQEEQPDADEVKMYIEKAGRKAVMLPGDLKDEACARRMVDEAHEKTGGLDILVLNAGMQQYNDDITTLDMDQVRDTFTINIVSMYYTVQQALKYMPAGSSIIMTSSIQNYDPGPGLLDYAATKAAIAAFSKGLSRQLAGKGIRVNSVAPGPIWTPIQVSGGQSREKLPEFGRSTPLGRAGEPAELAAVYVLLASQEAGYVTGMVYGVTGGVLTS